MAITEHPRIGRTPNALLGTGRSRKTSKDIPMNLTSLFRRVAPTVIAALVAFTIAVPAHAQWQVTITGTFTKKMRNSHGLRIDASGPVTTASGTGYTTLDRLYDIIGDSSPTPFPLSASVVWTENLTLSGRWIGSTAAPPLVYVQIDSDAAARANSDGGPFTPSLTADPGIPGTTTLIPYGIESKGSAVRILPVAQNGTWTYPLNLSASGAVSGPGTESIAANAWVGTVTVSVPGP